MEEKKIIPVAVVIPTLNEEINLNILLKSIREQTVQPAEIVVADANSKDRTREVAKLYNVKIVDGGILPVGRNNGANSSTSPNIIFFDADTKLPEKTSLNRLFNLFIESNADVASTFLKIKTVERNTLSMKFFMFSYFILKVVSSRMPRPFVESGACMLAKRSAFKKVNGFKKLKPGIAEDLDFSMTAIKNGLTYKVLPIKIEASGRRYKRFLPSLRVLVASIVSGFIVKHELYNYENLNSKTSKLYGPLGGADMDIEQLKSQEKPTLFVDKMLKRDINRAIGIAGGSALSIIAILALFSKHLKKDSSKDNKKED